MIYRTTKPHETPDSFASNAFVSQASLDPCTTVKLRLTTAHLIDDYKSSMSDIQWLYKLHKLEVGIFLIQNLAAKTGGFNRLNLAQRHFHELLGELKCFEGWLSNCSLVQRSATGGTTGTGGKMGKLMVEANGGKEVMTGDWWLVEIWGANWPIWSFGCG